MRKFSSLVPIALLLALLAGCASRAPSSSRLPGPGPWPDKDGPDAVIPPDLHKVPDALPKLEAIRRGGPNKPYEVLGQRYEPITDDQPLVERGLASWYGRKFHGRPTSSGEVYNMYAMTAAHPTMPIPSYARVRNPKNGREVIVRINDRGPFHAGRIIDLSYTAALKLDVLRGVSPVELERLTYEDIRTGAWIRNGDGGAPAAEPPPVFVASAAPGAPELSSTASVAPPAEAAPAPRTEAKIATGFWVQLGAYARLDGAEAMRQQVVGRLDWLAPLLAVVRDKGLHRLQAGPYANRDDARQAAERLRSELALQPLVVERR
ncbi:MAG TPA: septal ring lytic transglycosylase RlpA family protein [Roseateles sp.]|nr:septal ring lytic transglycosylase RlpA family protein [Roseateles sp.]